MKSLLYLFIATIGLAFISCDKDDGIKISLDSAGLNVKEHTADVNSVYAEVKNRVTNNGFTIVAEVNHEQAAAGVNLAIRPTQVIIFGNPEGGTKLMQANQRIGIDLPLKMLVYENEDGKTNAGYYDATTLMDRYDIENDDLKNNINNALDVISGGDQKRNPLLISDIFDKMIVKESPLSADQTFANLDSVLLANEFNIVAKVEHDKAAASVNLDLRPTKVIIFGKPQVGSQLMQSDNQMGIDLPMKMLVWEDVNGKVWVGYYDATFLTDRHDINDKDELVSNINMTLDNLSSAAIIQ